MVKDDEDIKEYIIEENNEFDKKIVKLMSEFNLYLNDIDENLKMIIFKKIWKKKLIEKSN